MRTYWLTGEDVSKRLARIREDCFSLSFASIDSDSKCRKKCWKVLFFSWNISNNFLINDNGYSSECFDSGLTETPDLLRRPAGELMLNQDYHIPFSLDTPTDALYDLHLRAFRAYSTQFSQVIKYFRYNKCNKNNPLYIRATKWDIVMGHFRKC